MIGADVVVSKGLWDEIILIEALLYYIMAFLLQRVYIAANFNLFT
jgi:hypothetical protein